MRPDGSVIVPVVIVAIMIVAVVIIMIVVVAMIIVVVLITAEVGLVGMVFPIGAFFLHDVWCQPCKKDEHESEAAQHGVPSNLLFGREVHEPATNHDGLNEGDTECGDEGDPLDADFRTYETDDKQDE